MTSKKFEISLTPQNDEWVNLIPNPSLNVDIIFNKIIDAAINEGLFLEVISQSLTLNDLAKFKSSYTKMQTTRAKHMADLEITPVHTERKRVVQTQTVEIGKEEIIPEEISVIVEPKAEKKEKKMSHGFSEESF
jgi:hypothetical protein